MDFCLDSQRKTYFTVQQWIPQKHVQIVPRALHSVPVSTRMEIETTHQNTCRKWPTFTSKHRRKLYSNHLRPNISDEDLRTILDEQSLETYTIPKGISHENELKLIRRRMQYVLHCTSIRFSIYKLLLGKKCLLEAYKSLEGKEKLLESIIYTRHIITMMIFVIEKLEWKAVQSNISQSSRCWWYIRELSHRYANF